MSYLDSLPEELLLEIFINVEQDDLLTILLVEPYNKLLSNYKIWMKIFLMKFPLVDVWRSLNIREQECVYYYLDIYSKSVVIYKWFRNYSIGWGYDTTEEIVDISLFKDPKFMKIYSMSNDTDKFGRIRYIYNNDKYYFQIKIIYNGNIVLKEYEIETTKKDYYNLLFHGLYHPSNLL